MEERIERGIEEGRRKRGKEMEGGMEIKRGKVMKGKKEWAVGMRAYAVMSIGRRTRLVLFRTYGAKSIRRCCSVYR